MTARRLAALLALTFAVGFGTGDTCWWGSCSTERPGLHSVQVSTTQPHNER